MIAPSITAHTIVDGYEIHLSGKEIGDKTIDYLRDLATTHGLSMDSKKSAVGIFKLKEGAFK